MRTNLLLTNLCLFYAFLVVAQQPAKTKAKTKTEVITNTNTNKTSVQNPVQTTKKKRPLKRFHLF